MVMFDLDGLADESRIATGTRNIFDRAVATIRQWLLKRETAAKLSRLNEHLRRDVGFEPADTYDPLNGGTAALWKKPHLRPDIR